MRILTILLIIVTFFTFAEAKRRRQKRNHVRPVVIVRDYGRGIFHVDRTPELLEYLEESKIRYRMGQNAIHNRFGLVHVNAMDVSVSPNSVKGQKLIAFLKSNGIPFLSISGRKRGVSTGPHVHIGFASPRLHQKFPVGTVNGGFNFKHCPLIKMLGVCI